jgi:hypothetical protein
MLTSLLSDIQRQLQEQDLKDRLWHKGSTPIKINVLENYLAEYNNGGLESYYYQDLDIALDLSILAPVYLYG